MILDNADDDSVLFDSVDLQSNARHRERTSLSTFLPQSNNGSILITSRSRQVAFQLTGRESDIVSVEPMHEDVAIKLLQKKLKDSSDQEGMIRLVKEVEYMPLAITQAASYINHRFPFVNPRSYVNQLRRNHYEQLRLLQTDLGDLRRDGSSSNSIILTLQISLDHIHRVAPNAASLLAWMSMFDRERIEIDLLNEIYRSSTNGDKRTPSTSSPSPSYLSDRELHAVSPTTDQKLEVSQSVSDALLDDVTTLMSYDLIRHHTTENNLSMHRLVQLSIWKWIDNCHGDLKQWQSRYVKFIDRQFPSKPDVHNRTRCQELFQHAMMLSSIQLIDRDHIRARSSALCRVGYYAYDMGQYKLGEGLLQESLNGYLSINEKDLSSTLCVMTYLSCVLVDQEKTDGVEEFLRDVIEQQKRQYGMTDLSTLITMHNLSFTLRAKGDGRGSNLLLEQILENSKDLTSYSDADILERILTVRGKTLYILDRHEEATRVLEQTIKMGEAKSKLDGLTMDVMDSIGLTYYAEGHYEKARERQETTLTTRTTILGLDNPDTAWSMEALARTSYVLRDYTKAETLCRRALRVRRRILPDHWIIYDSMCLLALILQKQQNYSEAKDLYEEGLDGLGKCDRQKSKNWTVYQSRYAELKQRLLLGEETSRNVTDATTLDKSNQLANPESGFEPDSTACKRRLSSLTGDDDATIQDVAISTDVGIDSILQHVVTNTQDQRTPSLEALAKRHVQG